MLLLLLKQTTTIITSMGKSMMHLWANLNAKQQLSVVFLKCFFVTAPTICIAMHSPVACCLIRKLSWCLRAQLSFRLPGKTATSNRATFHPTILSPKANTKQKEKAMMFLAERKQ
jgi:hypothetical protein